MSVRMVCRYCDHKLDAEEGIELPTHCPQCKRKSLEFKPIESNNPALGMWGPLNQFIFDDGEIVQKRVFTSHKLREDVFAFGILRPRIEDVLDKSGNVVNKEQIWRPLIITSDKQGIPVTKQIEIQYRIRYEDIPGEMSLRWEGKSIQQYLLGEAPEVDGKALFNKIRGRYEHYNYYREKVWYDVNALWDMGTYLHQLFVIYPIKEERGLSGTGKSKTMIVSSRVTLNATEIMVNPSAATLFRMTESMRPTKYIDEAEKLFRVTIKGLESDDRVELINASYSNNGAVARQEKVGDGKYVTKMYHVYSPTRIGSINGLYGATENRAITQVHTKAPSGVPQGNRQPEEDADSPIWGEIRDGLYLWSLQNWKRIHEAYMTFDMTTNLKQRDLQLWKAIIVIADLLDKGLSSQVIAFAERLSEQRQIETMAEGSLDYQLLDCFNRCLPAPDNIVYVDKIRDVMDETYPMDMMQRKPRKKGYNRTISSRLDKIGFGEFKGHSRLGSYYRLTKDMFDDLVMPITSDFRGNLSSQSSQSSFTERGESEKCDEEVTNVTQIPKLESSQNDPLVVSASQFHAQSDECDAKTAPGGVKEYGNGLNPDFIRIINYMKESQDPKITITNLSLGLQMDEETLKTLLLAMEMRGDVYRPRSGFVSLVRKEAPSASS